MTKPANNTDPLRLLHLLWSPHTKVGRSGTTLEAVIERAIELADAQGMAALTMRRLADEVGVGAMTLYGYVPGKLELLELMADRAAATTYEGFDKPIATQTWQGALRHIAQRNYAHALRHPWLGDLAPARPILGPGYLRKYEDELAPLDGIGLDDVEMDQALTHVLAVAHHAARWQTAMDDARATSELTDTQWWQAVAPHLGTVLGDDALPISSRVGQTLAHAGDPSGFCARAVDGVIAELEAHIRAEV